MNDVESDDIVSGIEQNMEKIQALSPDEMGAWGRFSTVTSGEGYLSPRGKEIIAVALSVMAKCQWCIAYHVHRALELGARKQEIIEAAWVSVLMAGSPALMYAQLVLKALEEYEDLEVLEKPEELEKSNETTYYPADNTRLFQQLWKYVDSLCDEVEAVCSSDDGRRKLALNIAKSDSRIIERLVRKECDNRGWEDPEEDLEYE